MELYIDEREKRFIEEVLLAGERIRNDKEFLRKNGLLRKFDPSKLTRDQIEQIREKIPNIKPNEEYNFYDVFYIEGDLLLMNKKNNYYSLSHYFGEPFNSRYDFPSIEQFKSHFKEEYKKWYDIDYLKHYQELWKSFVRIQRIKYGDKFVDKSVFDFSNTQAFKKEARWIVNLIRIARERFDSIIYVDKFVDKLEEDFRKNLTSLSRLPSRIFLVDKYIEEEFKKYVEPLEDHIRQLKWEPKLEPEIENINEYDKIREFKENAQRILIDTEVSTIERIRKFDENRKKTNE